MEVSTIRHLIRKLSEGEHPPWRVVDTIVDATGIAEKKVKKELHRLVNNETYTLNAKGYLVKGSNHSKSVIECLDYLDKYYLKCPSTGICPNCGRVV